MGSTIEEIAISGCGAGLRVVPAIPMRCYSMLFDIVVRICVIIVRRALRMIDHGQHRVFPVTVDRSIKTPEPGTVENGPDNIFVCIS